MSGFIVTENMIFWAFRYALGRKTGAVTDVVDHIKFHWKNFEPHTREQIKEEITQAIKNDNAGGDCDVRQWEEILKI
jgi:hypothetical protein